MQPQNIDREDFDFSKKITAKIDKQINKVDYSSYKKLAFFAVAIGVFVSAGVYFGNHIAPTLINNSNIVSKILPSAEVTNNLNAEISKLTTQDFDNTSKYYQNVLNMYDNKLEYVNKTLLQYNLQAKFSDTSISSENFRIMAAKINEHKETITEKINQFNSLKNKVLAKDTLSYKEAQIFLNIFENSKQHVFYQNTDVETAFNKNLVSAPKDITKYLMEQNVYDKIKQLDAEIKQSLQAESTTSVSIKPKM